jgi:serine protease
MALGRTRFTLLLVAAALLHACADDTQAPGNAPPTARFTSYCIDLGCNFTDRSTDSDGGVVGWHWNFGDGQISTDRAPGHLYSAGGTYVVTLEATDDSGATDQGSALVPVVAPSFFLSLYGHPVGPNWHMELQWTGATGTTVDVYRNLVFHINTLNDGYFVDTIPSSPSGMSNYEYQVCQAGSTAICSNHSIIMLP